jgi:alkanesulfonate monooxygenase SsuD/methylene tetrahydromethanopterin reductase-like flavin-dependent oxidoreductase (luciferase family)
LSEHCKKANRDYDTILKTKLTHIIIAEDQKEVESRVNERFGGVEEEAREDFAVCGTPEKVLDQIMLYEEIGIDYLIVNFDSNREMESIKIFANKIIRKA